MFFTLRSNLPVYKDRDQLRKSEIERDDLKSVDIEGLKVPGVMLPYWFIDSLHLVDRADPANADGTIEKGEADLNFRSITPK